MMKAKNKNLISCLYLFLLHATVGFTPISIQRIRERSLPTNSLMKLDTRHITNLFPSRHKTSLNGIWDSSDGEKAKNFNESRTCVKHFLTQRAVQSFMFLLEQCRDPHTVNWMEDFTGTPNILSFHGTGAFNITRFENWDSFLMEMVVRPRDRVIVSAKRRGAGHGGWSKNNPYLKPRYVEFNIDIDPASLTSRILSVREQIAKEWEADLDLVMQSGELILESYFDKNKNLKDDSQVYERTSTYMMNNLNPYATTSSSPFRKGNFDLLTLLATQESIHRILRELKAGGSKWDDSFTWLRDFYVERVPNFFDGNQSYGRYDDFLQELLMSSPTVKKQGEGKVSIIDPVGLTEKIIRMRGEVALEWKDIMKNAPTDHTELRRNLLNRQMQRDMKRNLDDQLKRSEVNEALTDQQEKFGEFE